MNKYTLWQSWFGALICKMQKKHAWKYPKGSQFKVCRRCEITKEIKRRKV